MKNNLKFLVYLIMSILVLSIVCADYSLPTSATLGSSSQDRGQRASATITLTNTDMANSLTGITSSFTTSLSGFTNNDFNITFVGASIASANTSEIYTFSGYVPLRMDSASTQIGTLIVSGNNGSAVITKSVAVYMQAENNIKIKDVEIEINEEDSEDVSDGESIDDIERGDSITLTVTIENSFSDSSDIDLNDIRIEIENDELDIDEEADLDDLNSGDDDETTITFDIPDDADDSEEKITMVVEAEDDNGATHREEFEFYLDVQVERYDLTVNEVSVNPSSVCPGQTININVDIENTGVRDLDRAMVYLKAEDLTFSKKISSIVLDEGDEKTVSATLTVPSTTRQGTYIITAETYYDTSSSSNRDTESGAITVKDCTSAMPSTTTTTTSTANQTTASGFQIIPQTTDSQVTFAAPASTKSKSLFGNSDNVIIALVFVNIVVLIVLVVLLTAGRRYY